ncbi:MAG: MFS transporter [Anaerolineaceae bacterium]|nr:MFS transporter [Anaerolineaceae bacterium]
MKALPAQALRFLRNPVVIPIYLPTLFFGMALGMMKPILPLYVSEFDVSYVLIGLVVGGEALGAMLADVPAGILLRRYTEKQVMLAGQLLVLLGMLLLFLAPTVWMAFLSLFMFGTGRALFNVSRHMFLSEQFSRDKRGRAISVFGGMVRMGYAIGPVIGGFIAARMGLRAPFLVVCAFALFGIILVVLLLRETRRREAGRSREEGLAVVETLRENRPLLARAGSGVLFGQAIRAGRSIIVPLYAADVLGLGPEAIGIIVSVSWMLDMLMFLPAGWVMDKRGRKHAIVPSFMIMATGVALIPLTQGFEGLMLATALIGLGNGFSSGSMMTLGSDLAPARTRGEFLGVWRLIGDSGATAAPFVIGFVAQQLALQSAAVAISGMGLMAAGIFAFLVPETLRSLPREQVRAATTGS